MDELIDVLEGNRVYIPAVVAVNKVDLIDDKTKLPKGAIPISAENSENLNVLREEIYERLGLMRVFTKKQREGADLEEPLILRRGDTVGIMCERLHRDLKKEFRYAMVWGKSVKHQPQRVGLDHVLAEGDIIMVIKR